MSSIKLKYSIDNKYNKCVRTSCFGLVSNFHSSVASHKVIIVGEGLRFGQCHQNNTVGLSSFNCEFLNENNPESFLV